MSKKTYRAKSKSSAFNGTNGNKQDHRQTKAKSTAIKLAVSFVLFISVYFGFIKAGIQLIQEIYIWSAFVIALCYVFCAFFIAYIKNSDKYKDKKGQPRSCRSSTVCASCFLFCLFPCCFHCLPIICLLCSALPTFSESNIPRNSYGSAYNFFRLIQNTAKRHCIAPSLLCAI